MKMQFLGYVLALSLCTTSGAQNGFVNWESPHVNPLDMTPDGTLLLAVNTADNRLEVFDLTGAFPASLGVVPVGLDPVSVRARTDSEAWVVNHISDSISIVDLNLMTVIATILTGDEPCDVVFAGTPTRAFVSVSQLNEVRVFDPSDPGTPPTILPIEGEDPRALTTDGTSVYLAIFESGNHSTILSQPVVSSPVNPYAGDANPPPNDGTVFSPALKPGLPAPPPVSLIVRKDANGNWIDDHRPTPTDWSAAVPWDLHDHDVAVIDANTHAITYVTGLMNLNMNLSIAPSGDVFVIGTEAINEVRFEPNVNGIFVRVMGASFSAAPGSGDLIADLNPHLDYTTPTVLQSVRDQSVGDPRGIDWSVSRNRAYIAGMGSNNLIAVDASFARLDRADVGEGPTGVIVDDPRGVAYVLNKFEGSLVTVDLDDLALLHTLPYHDPTPPVIRNGRPHLYDTHRTSGLGQASCGSCHVDGRMDQIAWDLGDPTGLVKPFNQTCDLPGFCEDWHPMKGPMTTQTLVGIIGTEPLHWRGDRENLAAFNGAFLSLMGDDALLTGPQMNQFTNFIATLTTPPNPNRLLNNSLNDLFPDGSNAEAGFTLYMFGNLDAVQCNDCHSLPSGTNGNVTPAMALLETQSIKVPQLRNMYEKTGFDQSSLNNNRGFGYIHDGSTDTLFEFLQFPGFQFDAGAAGDDQRRDVAAFLMSLGTDTHAGVGAQATTGGGGPDQLTRHNQLIAIADGGQVGLVAKGVVGSEPRGFFYLGTNTFQSDRALEQFTLAELDALSGGEGVGNAITYTLVPLESVQRMGVDRDADGVFDRDEYDQCSDPTDPNDIPGSDPCPPDIAGDDFDVNVTDLLLLLAQWGESRTEADIDCSGDVNVTDLLALLAAWGSCL